MSDNKWARTVAGLKKELACIETNSRSASKKLEILQRHAEFLKIELLKYSLEKQRTALARQRGFAFLIKDRKKVGTSLAVTAGALIFGGLLSKDGHVALNAGLSGLNGMLQKFGETRWAVSLSKDLVILPRNAMPAKGTWVTFESLLCAIDDLKTEALQGKRLGTLNNVIQRLQQSSGKLIYIVLPIEIQLNNYFSH